MIDDYKGYWPLNETSGDVFDFSGNSYTGTPTGTTSETGRVINARKFNGSSDFINIGDISALSPSQITVACWTKSTYAGASVQELVCKDDLGGGSTRSYSLFINGGTWVAVFNVFKSGSSGTVFNVDYNNAVSISAINDGNWHHVLGTWDGTDIKLYIDGHLNATTSFSGSIRQSSGVPLQFGQSQHGSTKNYLNGYLDEVKIFNRALTGEEANQVYLVSFSKQRFAGIRPKPFAPCIAR